MTQATASPALVSPRDHNADHVCKLVERSAEISIKGAGNIPLDPTALGQLNQLRLNIAAESVEVFLPLTQSDTQLHVSANIANGASAGFYLLSRGPVRETQFSIHAADLARADFYSLLDDASMHLVCEAQVNTGAEVKFTGLTRARAKTITRIEINVRHVAGNSRTDQKFYSYARDNAQISFTGRITVNPGASGTEAHQLHRGIALSAGARIDAQPFLNIMHDDVRCTHGSTVGFIDEEALAYLMARGLERTVAEQILIHSSERQFFDLIPAGEARKFYGIPEEQL